MLVLSRRVGETIRIGDSISVTVSRITGNSTVRLSIEAPKHVPIARSPKTAAGRPDAQEAG
ncbi:carbon storage regulator [Hydrocarboniphaga sp.]|uniref:carbon storage regulator n=1 Tax=Hydrocarboniphaga sp. TaxID=2033016 RepID=UPI003D0B43BA